MTNPLQGSSTVATPEQRALQREIIAELCVSPTFDARLEIERRTGFLADYLQSSGMHSLVLGISGGVDWRAAVPACGGVVPVTRVRGAFHRHASSLRHPAR